jgi:hypothetical protein
LAVSNFIVDFCPGDAGVFINRLATFSNDCDMFIKAPVQAILTISLYGNSNLPVPWGETGTYTIRNTFFLKHFFYGITKP